MNDKALAELFYDAARISHQRETRRDHSLIYGSGHSLHAPLGPTDEHGIRGGPVSQRRLAAILGIRSASLSELLGKMEARGWVARTPHPEDGRTYLVALTEEGKAEAMRRRAADNGATGKLLEVLTAQQREQFAEILTVIKEHYQELDKQNL